jgi:hypothetical protein
MSMCMCRQVNNISIQYIKVISQQNHPHVPQLVTAVPAPPGARGFEKSRAAG